MVRNHGKDSIYRIQMIWKSRPEKYLIVYDKVDSMTIIGLSKESFCSHDVELLGAMHFYT